MFETLPEKPILIIKNLISNRFALISGPILATIILLISFSACLSNKSTPEDYLQGLAAYNNGNFNQAYISMSRYSGAHSDLAIPHYWLGLIEWDRDRIDAARSEFQKAVSIAPAFSPALERLGYLELSTGNIDKAIEAYEKLGKLKPESADAAYRLGLSEFILLQGEKSAEHFQKALEKNPAHIPSIMAGYFSLHYLDNLQTVSHVLDLAIKARPDCSLFWLIIARNSQLMGQYDESEMYYKKALEVDPKNSKTPMELALRIYVPTGRIKEAIDMLKMAVALEPSRNSNRIDIGMLLIRENKLDEAERYLKEAVSIEPSSYQAYLALGHLETARNNYPAARKYFEKILQLEPNHQQAKFMISMIEQIEKGKSQ